MEDRFKFRQWAEQTKTMLYNIINEEWEKLTPEERKQIKEILE